MGPAPSPGGAIIRGQVKMVVTQPIPDDLWQWMLLSGWRPVPVRIDRRKCQKLPDHALRELIEADPLERDSTHARLLGMVRQRTTATT